MTRIDGLGMDDDEPTRRLFAVRIHPESAPHVTIALLAGSATEAVGRSPACTVSLSSLAEQEQDSEQIRW